MEFDEVFLGCEFLDVSFPFCVRLEDLEELFRKVVTKGAVLKLKDGGAVLRRI